MIILKFVLICIGILAISIAFGALATELGLKAGKHFADLSTKYDYLKTQKGTK